MNKSEYEYEKNPRNFIDSYGDVSDVRIQSQCYIAKKNREDITNCFTITHS